MRYEASFVVAFDATSDAEAFSVANQHHVQIHDGLRIEGADHPYEITFERLEVEGRNVLPAERRKVI